MKPQHLASMVLLGAAALAALGAGPAAAQGRVTRDVPYATSFVINVGGGIGAGGTSPDVVPSTKRLVIEFVSLSVSANPGDQPAVFLNDSVNDVGHTYWIPLTLAYVANSGVEVWRASQAVKLYHDSARTFGPSAQCMRNVNSFAPMSCHVTLSGYLVDK